MDEAANEPTETDKGAFHVSRRAAMRLAGGATVFAVAPNALAQNAAPVQTAGAVEAVRIALTVNGEATELEIDPRQSLLDVLREELDLTGTKKGCNQGACGACTILLDGRRINACLTLAVMHDGARITTIEGLAEGGVLHPLQTALIEHDGLQCGYCTPGQIMSGLGCIAEGHTDSIDDIRFWMSGNICRCGAYPGIVAAIADASERT